MEPKGKNAIYHTVVNDNDNLQILCLLKYAARCLRNKNHQSLTVHKLFSSTTTGRGRLLFKAVAFLQRDTRSKTYCALFPALQPREFIELREELLLRNCEHKHVQKYTYLEPNSTILSHKLPISHEKDGASDIINSKSHPVFFTCWEWKSRVCRVCVSWWTSRRRKLLSAPRGGSEKEDFLEMLFCTIFQLWKVLHSSSGSLFQLKEAVLLTLWGLAAVSWKNIPTD